MTAPEARQFPSDTTGAGSVTGLNTVPELGPDSDTVGARRLHALAEIVTNAGVDSSPTASVATTSS